MSQKKKKLMLGVLVVTAVLGAGTLYMTFPLWAMALSVICPLIFGSILSEFLDEHQFTESWMDADWRSDDK